MTDTHHNPTTYPARPCTCRSCVACEFAAARRRRRNPVRRGIAFARASGRDLDEVLDEQEQERR